MAAEIVVTEAAVEKLAETVVVEAEAAAIVVIEVQ